MKLFLLIPICILQLQAFAQKNNTGISLYEKLYTSWKIVDSNNAVVPYAEWNKKILSGDYLLAEHPYNALKKNKRDTSIKQLFLMDEDMKEKRAAYRKLQLNNVTFNINGIMPNFEIEDCDDSIFTPKSLMGKPYVLYVCCFSSCSNCLWELAEADKLCKEYKDSGVTFIAINYERKRAALHKIKVSNNLDIALAHNNDAFEKIVQSLGDMPMRIVVDKYGKIVHKANSYSYMEVGDESLYTYAVRAALAKCLKQ